MQWQILEFINTQFKKLQEQLQQQKLQQTSQQQQWLEQMQLQLILQKHIEQQKQQQQRDEIQVQSSAANSNITRQNLGSTNALAKKVPWGMLKTYYLWIYFSWCRNGGHPSINCYHDEYLPVFECQLHIMQIMSPHRILQPRCSQNIGQPSDAAHVALLRSAGSGGQLPQYFLFSGFCCFTYLSDE